MFRLRSNLLVLLSLALLSACAPGIAPMGPGPITTPGAEGFNGESFITEDGLALPYRLWPAEAQLAEAAQQGAALGQPKAVILALHGFNDYSNAFESPGNYWSAKGIATYAYDQRGFGKTPNRGLWPGKDVLTGDLASAVRSLREIHRDVPLYLLGESMGGAVIIAAAARGELPKLDGVILSAPAVWARETMPWYQRWALWLGSHTLPWATVTGRGLDIQASDNIEMLRGLGRDPLVIKETRIGAVHGLVNLMDAALVGGHRLETRALLLYGRHDEIIPPAPMLRLWQQRAPNDEERRLALYDEGWHMLLRDLQADVVLEDISTWILHPGGTLPSGADIRALKRLRESAEESLEDGES